MLIVALVCLRMESDNVEFCESSLLVAAGTGVSGEDLDGTDGTKAVFPVDAGGTERTLGLARFGVAEILLLL